MRIEAVTRIDYDAYHTYFLFNFMQGRNSPWQARLLIALPPVMTAAFITLFIMDPTDVVNMIGMLLALLFCFVLVMIIFVMPRRYFKSVEKLLSLPVHYLFTDEHFEVFTEGIQQPENAELDYALLTKAYEVNGYFFLYLKPDQPLIIGKGDFKTGAASDLSSLLAARLGQRFQIVGAPRRT